MLHQKFSLRTLSYASIFVLASLASAQSPVVSTDSVSPQNGSGSSQVFTFQFSDSAGFENLSGHILINSSPSGTNSCWVFFGAGGGLSLAPDDANGGWPYMPYGTDTVVQNNQCAIDGAHTNR